MEKSPVYIRDIDVAARRAEHRMSVWKRLNSDPTFPKPYRFSPRCVRWKLSEIESWEASKKLTN